MQITTSVKDDISPQLARLAEAIRNRKPLMKSIGMQLAKLGRDAFEDPSLRATPWRPSTKGSFVTLKSKKAHLWRSIRMVKCDEDSATVGSDRPYAAIHQFGGQTSPHVIKARDKKALAWPGMSGGPYGAVHHPGSKIPPRPFLPITASGQLTPAGAEAVRALIEKYFKAQSGG